MLIPDIGLHFKKSPTRMCYRKIQNIIISVSTFNIVILK